MRLSISLVGIALLSAAMTLAQPRAAAPSGSATLSQATTLSSLSAAADTQADADNNRGDHDRDCPAEDNDPRDNEHGDRDRRGLLPPGYLHTRGSQIVDCHGHPVRIAAVGWASCLGNGVVGWVPDGLNDAPLQTMMNNIETIGFNTIRVHWADPSLRPAVLPYTYASGSTNGNNPQLEGKTSLQVFDAFVAAAGKAGLKVIFDHNANEYQCGQQASGLWFDRGPGSNNTDGGGTAGTVTAHQFQADTVALASRYAGNSTVIGYDLHNEPHPDNNNQTNQMNWNGRVNGDTADGGGAPGNPTDIAAMYQTVGNAVERVAPGVLIIAEGFQDYGAGAPWGDLRYVKDHPLSLNIPNKLVYSVHNYPYAVSGWQPDSGPSAVAAWQSVYGFVQTQRVAPVWIGELGDSLDGPGLSNPESLAELQAWATDLLNYMNGKQPYGIGPRFSDDQQPMSGDWWSFGLYPGGDTDGILQNTWGDPTVKPGQQHYFSQLFFRRLR